jgi:hypothetical protein
MKKILSVIFAVIMVFSSLSLFAFAKEEEIVPVVVLQGYSGPTLVYADENGEPIIDEETGDVIKAWPVDFGKIGEQVLEALPGMVAGKLVGEDAIVEAAVPIVKETLMPLVILEDGTSWQNLTYYPKGAKATQVSTLMEKGMEEYIPESIFVEEAVKRVGAENVFGFTFDWRRSQLDYAKALDEYIEEVKEITGSDKVDLMGLSHGGQYGTTYLYYYGDKGNVRNAILANPATGGTTFVSSFFMKEYIDLDLKNIMKFVQYSFDMEEDYDWIFDLLSLENIVGGINRVLQEERIHYRFSNIPSLLDFVPMDRFEEVIDFINLNPETNGKLYYDTVKYHNDVHTGTNLADKFAELQKNGTKIGYIVGCGYTALSSVGTNSDFLIDTYLGSGGATCAPFGETFEAGYVQNGLVCNDKTHYHISPEFNIDASTGALPDNTWYAIGQGHGQYFNEPYTRQIVCEFLWGDLETVFDDDRYPQFNYTQKHADNIYVHFNNTDVGYHSSADTELIVENLSNTSPIYILCVEVNGADMDYVHEMDTVLQVGEKYVINIDNISPETADKPFKVAVTYIIDNAMHTFVTKEFSFIAMSDENMEIYSHLAKKTVDEEVELAPEETVKPEEPTYEAETETKPETQKPVVNETTTEEKETITDVEILNTDGFQANSVVVALVACGVAFATTTVVLKKKED